MEKNPLRILLADDDEVDRMLFKDAFKELKIKSIVHTVNNGTQLMDFLAKNDADLPHLIFLDLNMPCKNGLECLKEIRSNEKFKKIPIAIYSTSASENDIKETFRNLANVYIKKPGDFSILKQLLAKVVSSASLYQNSSFNIENFLLRI
jgi:CheY-like chemotaxis protein